MTNFSNNNDAALFDRLVDGELTASERQQLLASLDSHEDGWRHCALAFLESQAWGGEFKQLLTERNDEQLADEQQIVRKNSSSNQSSMSMGKWLTIAASLLFAFSLGWLTSFEPTTNENQPRVADVERQEITSPDKLPEPDELLDPRSLDAVTLLVRDTDGKNQRLQVPLMEVEDLDNQFSAALPAELRARLRDRGFDVQRRRRFAPMFFEQDQQLVPMVVPVDDTYVVPVNRPVY